MMNQIAKFQGDLWTLVQFCPIPQRMPQKSLTWPFNGQFFFQNDVFNLQKYFSEHEIRVFIENELESFHTFFILQIWDKPEVIKIFQKQFWKQDSKSKKPCVLWFRKILCSFFSKLLKVAIFSVSGIFIEDYLRNLTCWKKSKNRFGLSAPKLSKNRWFFSTHKILG
jgi:hypothetical protein